MSPIEYRTKRRRSSSLSSSSSSQDSSRSPSPAPIVKYHRLLPSPSSASSSSPSLHAHPYTCNLPPTCSQPSTSTSYTTEEELLRHQEIFHRWVCRTPIRERNMDDVPEWHVPTVFRSGKKDGRGWKECGKVFPEGRLLNLHQTETHDPIARARQARGEKIFECFVPPPGCSKKFSNPASRRRHLIAKHHYPEQYFFSITNHGINKIAEEDGLAISLIRPKRDYVARPPPQKSPSKTMQEIKKDDGQITEEQLQPDRNESQHTVTLGNPIVQEAMPDKPAEGPPDVEMDALVQDLSSSLQFIPKGVRKKQAAKG